VCCGLDLSVLRLHILDQVDDAVGVAHLVIVPRDKLDEGRRQLDSGLGVEDRRVVITDEVGGDDGLVGVAEEALQGASRGGLEGSTDLLIGGLLLQPDGQVDDGDIGGGHAEGHTGQLAVEFWDDLSDGLSGAGGGGDDVLSGSASASPVLV